MDVNMGDVFLSQDDAYIAVVDEVVEAPDGKDARVEMRRWKHAPDQGWTGQKLRARLGGTKFSLQRSIMATPACGWHRVEVK